MTEADWPIWIKLTCAFLLALLSGVVAYLQQFAAPEGRPKFDFVTFLVKALTAGFAGVLTFLLLGNRGVDNYILAFMLALAGWGGTETVKFFQEIFHDTVRKLAKSPPGVEEGADDSPAPR